MKEETHVAVVSRKGIRQSHPPPSQRSLQLVSRLMGKKTIKLAAGVREVTLSLQFAPSALLVLSAMVVGFWLIHFVKVSIS